MVCSRDVLTAVVLFFASASGAMASKQVQLIVNLPRTTPSGSAIYLTGSTPELCSWSPRCIRLNALGPYAVGTTLTLPETADAIEFKITRGSWSTEQSDSMGRALANLKFDLASARPVVVNVAQWRDRGPLGVTGHVDRIENVYSPQLKVSQDILVWLPLGYTPKRRYPVIYMHDGRNVFDPATASYGVDWSMDEAMTELVESGAIPPAIVVAIDHGPNRMSQYTWSIQGKAYGDFLVDTVKPYIDRHYSTVPDRAHTFTMGSSMGAMISFSLLWIRPDVFSAAAGLSIPPRLQGGELFKIIRQFPKPTLPVRWQMDCGDAGYDIPFLESAIQFDRALTALGWGAPGYRFGVIPFADHTESNWAARLDGPIRFLLGN